MSSWMILRWQFTQTPRHCSRFLGTIQFQLSRFAKLIISASEHVCDYVIQITAAKGGLWSGSLTTELFDYSTIGLANYNGLGWTAVHAQLAALAVVNVDKGGFVIIDTHEGFGLAYGLRSAAAAVATTVVVDP